MNSILLSCALTLFVATVALGAPTAIKLPWQKMMESKAAQMNYLRHYGHWAGSKDSESAEDFINSLKSFQRFYRLKETGEVDKETLKLMQTPRCGVPDRPENVHREKRYALFARKWENTNLTYSFLNYSTHVTVEEARTAIAKAMQFWSDVSSLTFTEMPSDGRIKMLFAQGAHGDGSPFDGPGKTIAHGFPPTHGGLHFDDSESWTVNSSNGADLLQAATHELGHVIGLDHSWKYEAVMYGYAKPYSPDFHLDDDDIKGIHALYGPKTN